MLPYNPVVAQPKIIPISNFFDDIRVTSTVKHLFGSDLATGDFNGDGYDDVLIGAYLADSEEGKTVGEAHILFGGRNVPSFIDYDKVSPFLTVIHGDDPLDYTGRSVASGDVNGDGIDDAIIGAPQLFQFTIGGAGRGRVYVVYGRRDWPREINLDTDGAAVPGVTRIVGKAPENFAGEVACGDVNGDGYFDVVIGAFAAGPPGCCGPKEGEAYILYGSDSLDAVIELQNLKAGITTIQGTQTGEIGEWVGCFDLNGDALADVFIGQPRAGREDGAGNAGRAYILYGAENFPEVIDLDAGAVGSPYRKTVVVGAAGDEIGWEFGAGDVNNDGIADLLLGTRHRTESKNFSPSNGKMYVLLAMSNDLPTIDLTTYDDKLVIHGRDLGGAAEHADQLGQELTAGDFNGDGFADILTSAPFARASGTYTGECYIIYGSRDIADKREWPVLDNEHHVEIRGYQKGQRFGNALAAGDLNGDGIDDIIIAASFTYSAKSNLIGAVFVLYGRREGEKPDIPETAELQPNYPNPFNGFTILPYTVRERQHITLKIVTVAGQVVRTLVDNDMEIGTHRAIWEGQDQYFAPISSGVYFARLQGENFSQTRKLLFLK